MPDSSGAVDLSTAKSPSLDSLSPEEQEALSALADLNPEPEGIPVRTAFLVLVDRDGTVNVHPDITLSVVRDLVPTSDDVYGALKTAAKDIEVQETAQASAAFMQQVAMAQMQARQNAALASQLNLGK